MSNADIRRVIRRSSGWFTEKQVAEACDAERSDVHRVINGLASHGFIFVTRGSGIGKQYKVAGRRE